MKRPNKVLLIGWDAADWKVIEPLIEQGKMPALKGLMEKGVYGKIQTLDPPLSPMLWTSIATGFRADKHGIGGFIEPNPDGTGLRPVTSTSRKVKAIWNILHNQGYKSNVIAWWPSNPVEPINGTMISNLYQIANKNREQEWKMPFGTVHPVSMEEQMKQWRVHPDEITLAMTLPFIPNLASDIELRKDRRTAGVLNILANAASVHAATTYLMSQTQWDFMAVYHDAIDHFSHVGMKYHPPCRPEIDQQDYENFNGIVEAGYCFHDMMLERTLNMIDEDTTVIIVSDHGFYSDHQRPLYIPKEPSGPAVEHSPYGILVMAGPGIKKGGQRVSGASILDITPTLLHLYGLPIGKDMEGKVLHAVFDESILPKEIDSWEELEGDFGMHDHNIKEDPWMAMEALQQLVELGYIDEIGDDKLKEVEKAKRESQYYIARNLINGGKVEKAISILEEIFGETKILRYGQRLAYAYLSQRKITKCQDLIAELRQLEKENFEKRIKDLKSENVKDTFANQEMEEPMYLEFVEGLLLLYKNEVNKALPLLESVQGKNPNNMQVAINIGKIHNLRKNYVAAQKQFIKALAIDGRNANAHHGLGISFLRTGELENAVEEFFAAIDENFYMPNVHYHLGETFMKTGHFKEAAAAFEVAVRLSPGMTKAYKWLLELYTNELPNKTLKQQYEKILLENIIGERTILTGVSGSGCEEILEFLMAEGIKVQIEEDAENTASKFLISEVRNLHANPNGLIHLEDRLIYVPPQMLSFLSPKYNYKVLLVKRDLIEVMDELEGQKKLVGNKKKEGSISLRNIQSTQKSSALIDNWIEAQPSLKYMQLDYNEFKLNNKDFMLELFSFLKDEDQ